MVRAFIIVNVLEPFWILFFDSHQFAMEVGGHLIHVCSFRLPCYRCVPSVPVRPVQAFLYPLRPVVIGFHPSVPVSVCLRSPFPVGSFIIGPSVGAAVIVASGFPVRAVPPARVLRFIHHGLLLCVFRFFREVVFFHEASFIGVTEIILGPETDNL